METLIWQHFSYRAIIPTAPVTCTLALTWPPVLRKRLCMSELNSPERSSWPFVDPGKARPCQSLPPFISTQKPPVRLLPAGYCWSDLCLVTWTAMRYEAIVSSSKQTRLSGLTRNYSSTWKLQWNEEVFLLHWIFAGRCPNLGGRSLLSSARSDVWFVLCVRVYLW